VKVDLRDNDTAGVILTQSDGSTTVIKNGAGDTYTVRLTKAPVGTVRVNVVLPDEQLIVTSNRFDAGTTSVAFDASNWWVPVVIQVTANASFVPAPGSQNIMTFPVQPRTLSLLQGPLAIQGFTGSESNRDLVKALTLPSETDPGPLPPAVAPVDENLSVDQINVFNDGSQQPDTGALTANNLSGLGMSANVTFNTGTAANPNFVTFAGGISYQDVEILNFLLGRGDDALTVRDTRELSAANDGLTAIHASVGIQYGAAAALSGNRVTGNVLRIYTLGPTQTLFVDSGNYSLLSPLLISNIVFQGDDEGFLLTGAVPTAEVPDALTALRLANPFTVAPVFRLNDADFMAIDSGDPVYDGLDAADVALTNLDNDPGIIVQAAELLVTSANFTITIHNDTLPEGVETVLLRLSEPTNLALLGNPTQAVLRILQEDSDGDGVPDDVENGSPAGADVNGDGIPDSLQSHVATMTNVQDNQYVTFVARSAPVSRSRRE
jgi:hypothetical protein